jgi:hypothetical protein
MTCDSCRKKKTCTELCEEAEAFVKQDNVAEHTWGREVAYSLNYVSNMATTGIDLEEIEERKTKELLFYFQKINSMKDNPLKAITAMIFVGIPIPSIARYLKTDIRQIYRFLKHTPASTQSFSVASFYPPKGY